MNVFKPILQICTFFVVIACQSCSSGAGEGEFRGTLILPSCGLEKFDFNLKVDFFAASYFDNTLTMIMQHTGQERAFADGLVLVVRDVEQVNQQLSQALELIVEPSWAEFLQQGPDAGMPTTTRSSPARATLYLNKTCPDNTLGFTDGAGTLVFDHIYLPDKERRIKGSLRLQFVDPRTWESLEKQGDRAEINGEFDFKYSFGSPAQPFPGER
jgi:hypothetical protein